MMLSASRKKIVKRTFQTGSVMQTFICSKVTKDSPTNREELRLLKLLDYKHIISIFGSYTHKEKLHVLLEPVCEANLWEFLSGSVKIPEYSKIPRYELGFILFNWMNCLAGAVKFLHDRRVLYRHLKPQNILIKGRFVYLADFGVAVQRIDEPKSGIMDDNDPGRLQCPRATRSQCFVCRACCSCLRFGMRICRHCRHYEGRSRNPIPTCSVEPIEQFSLHARSGL
jgi:serine/threonine protein kinase